MRVIYVRVSINLRLGEPQDQIKNCHSNYESDEFCC